MDIKYFILFFFYLRVFDNALLGKEEDSNLVLLHVLVFQEKKKHIWTEPNNDLCVYMYFIQKNGRNCGIKGAGKRRYSGGITSIHRLIPRFYKGRPHFVPSHPYNSNDDLKNRIFGVKNKTPKIINI